LNRQNELFHFRSSSQLIKKSYILTVSPDSEDSEPVVGGGFVSSTLLLGFNSVVSSVGLVPLSSSISPSSASFVTSASTESSIFSSFFLPLDHLAFDKASSSSSLAIVLLVVASSSSYSLAMVVLVGAAFPT
jgi:hypothetical protein